MFVTLEKIAQVEPKYVDIVLLENYAAFQHRFFSPFFSLIGAPSTYNISQEFTLLLGCWISTHDYPEYPVVSTTD